MKNQITKRMKITITILLLSFFSTTAIAQTITADDLNYFEKLSLKMYCFFSYCEDDVQHTDTTTVQSEIVVDTNTDSQPSVTVNNNLHPTRIIRNNTGSRVTTQYRSVPGARGAQGPQGIPGPKGDRGPQGEKGDRGDSGPAGRNGRGGAHGRNGRDGASLLNIGTGLSIDPNSRTIHCATDGHILQYSQVDQKWNCIAPAAAAGATNIDDLADVDTSTTPPNLNQVLAWDGVNWVPDTIQSVFSLWDHDNDTGVQIEENNDEDYIRFDTAGSQRMVIDNTGNLLLSDTDPASLSNPGNIQGLLYRDDKFALRVGETNNNEWDNANIGNGTFASGEDNIVSGWYSAALGGGNNVSNNYSTALGRNNTVSGSYAVAGGSQNVAGGYASSVFGQTNQATDRRAMAWGLDNIASQDEATAWGRNTRASANYATSWGRDTQASGNYSTAFGYQNTASNDYGLAFGFNNIISGRYATGWGGQNNASGQYSTTWGSHNTASGAHSTAFGYHSEASAQNATAIGNSLANSNYMTAIGRFNENVAGQSLTNWVDTDQLFVIGNGTGWQNANRSNALTILKNGTITAPTFSLAEINTAGDTALTTKEYVDGAILAGTNNIYTNDGTLTGDRIVTSNGNSLTFTGTNSNSFSFAASDGASNNSFFDIGEDEMEFDVSDGSASSGMIYNPGTFAMSATPNNLGAQRLEFNMSSAQGILVKDSVFNRGIDYDADYSANYTNRTLVDKEYVDDAINVAAPFRLSGNIISNSNGGSYATDDFVFGSPSLDDDGDADHQIRMFFDKSKGAFRAGKDSSGQWDDANIGDYSFAFGGDDFAPSAIASGYSSFAIGEGAEATGVRAIAFGVSTASGDDSFSLHGIASGEHATSIGLYSRASGDASVGVGEYSVAHDSNEVVLGSFNIISTGDENNWIPTDSLLVVGNGDAMGGGRSNAFQILKNGTIIAPDFSIAEINTAGNTALTTKEYVDGAILASAPTLYLQDGTLSGDRTLSGNNHSLSFSGMSDFNIDTPYMFFDTGGGAELEMDDEVITWTSQAGQLVMDSNDARWIDLRAPSSKAGIEYGADYSADFTDRTLVDKEYVDNSIVSSANWFQVIDGGTNYLKPIATHNAITFGAGGDKGWITGDNATLTMGADVIDMQALSGLEFSSDQIDMKGQLRLDTQNNGHVARIYTDNLTAEQTFQHPDYSGDYVVANNAGAANGDLLTWNGANWVTTTPTNYTDNIYTANGTLTGNRTVTGNSNTLTFTDTQVGINRTATDHALEVYGDDYDNMFGLYTLPGDGAAGMQFFPEGSLGMSILSNGAGSDARIDVAGDQDFIIDSNGVNNRLFIQGSDGNVGINNASPQVKLHVKSDDGEIARFESSDLGTVDYLSMWADWIGNDISLVGKRDTMTKQLIGVNNTGVVYIADTDIVIENNGDTSFGGMFPARAKVDINGGLRLDGAFQDKDGDAGTIGQILSSTVNGTDWIDANTLALGSIDSHSDVDTTTVAPLNNQVLSWNGANWIPANATVNTDNQQITLNGATNILTLSNGTGADTTADFSAYLDNTDNQDLTLTGNTLAISNDPNTDVDLSPYLDNTDDQTADTFNIQANVLHLSLEDDGQADYTVDLSSYLDNTDDQKIDNFAFVPATGILSLSMESDGEADKTVDLSSLAHTGTAGSIFFAGADTKPTEDNANLFWDDTNNRLGIGLNNPTENLEVSGNIKTINNAYLAMLSSPTNGQGGYFQGTAEAGANAGYGAWMNYNTYWNGSNWIQPRGSLNSMLYSTNHHLGWTWQYAVADGTDGATVTPTEVAKISKAGGLQLDDTLHVDGTGDSYMMGDVGIHNNNPSADLHITGTDDNEPGLIVEKNDNDIATVVIRNGGSSGEGLKIEAANAAGANTHLLDVGLADGVTSRLVVNANGNVGIGVTDPDAELEVNGQVKITGGTPGDGKVLTSDANGLAEWKDIDITDQNLQLESSRMTYENFNASFLMSGDKEDYQYHNYINANPTHREIVRDYSAPGASGSLKVTGTGSTYTADDFIAVNPDKKYRGVVTAMQPTSNTAGARYYWGIVSYDADKLMIQHQMVNYYGNTVTTLSQALNPGDTVMHLTSVANWYDGPQAHRRGFRVWRLQADGKYAYVGPGGKQYDELGYSREGVYYGWSQGAIDAGNNTITLNSGWSGSTIPAGTKLANFYGGGTYTYYISSKTVTNDGQWQTYKSPWRLGEGKPQDNNGSDNAGSHAFRNGTSYVKMLGLFNYRKDNNTAYDANDVGYYSILGLEATSPDNFSGKDGIISYDGKVGIGTTTPGAYALYVNGDAYATGTWQSSDARWKKNVVGLDDSLSKLLRLRGVSYDWKQEEYQDMHFSNKKQVGLIAQEVEEILPEAVSTDDNGFKSVSYQSFVPLLIEGIKTQQLAINNLHAKVDTNSEFNESVSQVLGLEERLAAIMASHQAEDLPDVVISDLVNQDISDSTGGDEEASDEETTTDDADDTSDTEDGVVADNNQTVDGSNTDTQEEIETTTTEETDATENNAETDDSQASTDEAELANEDESTDDNGLMKLIDNVWNFVSEVIFKMKVTFEGVVDFLADVHFGRRTTFADKDMAGTAVILEGEKEVEVEFETPFAQPPFVTAVVNNSFTLYQVNDVSVDGFKIIIPNEAEGGDIKFTWQALAVQKEDTNTIEEDGVVNDDIDVVEEENNTTTEEEITDDAEAVTEEDTTDTEDTTSIDTEETTDGEEGSETTDNNDSDSSLDTEGEVTDETTTDDGNSGDSTTEQGEETTNITDEGGDEVTSGEIDQVDAGEQDTSVDTEEDEPNQAQTDQDIVADTAESAPSTDTVAEDETASDTTDERSADDAPDQSNSESESESTTEQGQTSTTTEDTSAGQ